MKKFTKLLFFICCLCCHQFGFAQLVVTPDANANNLATNLVGAGVTISNVTLVCGDDGAGTFDGSASNIGIGTGILLTTGDVFNAVGPNDINNATTNTPIPGDPDLEAIAGFTTNDACVLEFDFVPQGNTISFNYTFASEEYPEYFCTTFNDPFAWLVSGPNPAGGTYVNQNIAIIPGTTLPVTVNNLGPGECNGIDNSALFVDNTAGTTVQYDGWTTVLVTLVLDVVPCGDYHIKLAIADASDSSLDSGVFLEENSFVSTITVDASNGVLSEDCTTLITCGESVELALQDVDAIDWEWSPATGLNTTTGTTVTASPSVTTVYTVSATDPDCPLSKEITVEVDLCPETCATPVECGGTVSGTTVDGPPITAPECGTVNFGSGAVWHSFVGTGDLVIASLCDSDFDTQIGIYTGSCAALECVAGTDDGGACGLQSEVAFISAPGVTYYILIDGWSGQEGNYELNLECQDNPCENPTPIVCNEIVSGNTTDGPFSDVPICGTSYDLSGSNWYALVGDGGVIDASLCGSLYDTKIGIFTGDCDDLQCVVGTDDDGPCGLQSQVSFQSVLGETYLIFIHGWNGAEGEYTLTMTCCDQVSFDLPETACDTDAAFALVGSPTGGTFSGPGVSSPDGGLTYEFDPSAPGLGDHTITYETPTVCEVVTADITVCDIPELVVCAGPFPTGQATFEGDVDGDGLVDNCSFTVCNGEGFQQSIISNVVGATAQVEIIFPTGLLSGGNPLPAGTSNQIFPLPTNGVFQPQISNPTSETLCLEYTLTPVNSACGDCVGTPVNYQVCWPPDAQITCPADIVVPYDEGFCDALVFFDIPEITGGCEGDIVVCTDDGAGFYPIGTNPITCTVINANTPANAPSTCTFNIIVTDPVAPEITCPPTNNVTGICGIDEVPSLTSVADFEAAGGTIFDCSAIAFVTESSEIWNGSYCPRTYVRTYQIADVFGNIATCSYEVNVIDDVAPTFNAMPTDLVLECDGTLQADAVYDWLFSWQGTDACGDAVMTHDFVFANIPEGCSSTTPVTFTLTDDCENPTVAMANLVIEDNTDPVWTNAPMDITVDCNGEGNTVQFDLWFNSFFGTDVCGETSIGAVPNFPVDGCGATSSTTINFFLSDECDNQISQLATFTIEDTTPPVLLATPEDVTVACNEVPLSFPNIASDNCTDNDALVIEFTETSVPGACANEETITRTWSVSDDCGLETVHTQTLTVVDESMPVWINPNGLPTNLAVSCDDIPDAAVLTAIDFCTGAITASLSESSADGDCANESTITRTWTAADACGNALVHVQVLTVEDNVAPTIICPEPALVECGDPTTTAALGTATATDNCDVAPLVDFDDDFQQACGNTGTILRTWTATDACGNATNCVQIILIQDTTDPVVNCPNDISGLNCLTPVPDAATTAAEFLALPGAGFADACAGTDFTVDHEDVENGLSVCPNDGGVRTISRTYTLTDPCGTVSTCTQLISYANDLTNPTIACPADAGGVIACGADIFAPDISEISVTVSCGLEYEVTVANPVIVGDVNCDGATYTYTYTVEDQCGRMASCDVVYELSNGDPEFTCWSNKEIVCGETDVATEIDMIIAMTTATNSCGTELEVINDYVPGAIACAGQYIINFSATDDCGRTSTCATHLMITNGSPVFEVEPQDAFVICDSNFEHIDGTPNNETEFQNWLDSNGGAVANDMCCGDGLVWSVVGNPSLNEVFGGCTDGTGDLDVTFVATDAYGNQISSTATFSVVDPCVPEIITPPTDFIIECGETNQADFEAWLANYGGGVAIDNCSEVFWYTEPQNPQLDDCEPGSSTSVTFMATDACNNGTMATVVVNVMGANEYEQYLDQVVLATSLLDFRGKANGEIVNLDWRTATEENLEFFLVDHSTNGVDFTQIGQVDATGTVTSVNDYKFDHLDPSKGFNYYRLRLYHSNATIKYSELVIVEFVVPFDVSVYPNPATEMLFFTPVDEDFTYRIISVDGRVVTENYNATVFQYVDISTLPVGMYFIEIEARDATVVHKFVKK